MTLRRRLLLATSALAVVLLVAGTAVLLVQRAFLLDRLDAQLEALTSNPRALVLASQRAPGGGLSAGLGDVYVGRMGADGRLVTLLTPTTDPTLVPDIAPGESIRSPSGRATTSGDAARVRVVTAPLPNGRASAVIALPTTALDAATRSLALTLGLVGLVTAAALGLLLWWVDRLGLRPIAQMTAAADAISAGDTGRRAPPGPPGTEAARLGEAFNAMLDTTTRANEQMRRFVADASHELRTPLTTLQGYAALHTSERAAGPRDEADVDDAMRRIGEESARMRRLVDGLFDLADLDEPARLSRAPVDLALLLRDAAADLRVAAPGRTVTLEGPDHLLAPGDRDRLSQAVVGLTSNAVRHTPPGAAVHLRLVEEPGLVRVEVADDGPGIPAEHLPHVFDRFYRVDPGRSSGRGGSGLGLAIVAAIAHAHGGSVVVRSEPGRGTAFVLSLPR